MKELEGPSQFEFNYSQELPLEKEKVPLHQLKDLTQNGPAPLIDQEFWSQVKQSLKARQPSNKPLETWFAPVNLHSVDLQEFGYVIRLSVPTPLHEYWLTENLLEDIKVEISRHMRSPFRLEFIVTGIAPHTPANEHIKTSDIQVSPETENLDLSNREKLNHNYTFSTFVVGRNNEFAHAACFNVAERPGGSYNPLFICGPTGMGKTHLLNAVGNHIREKNPGMRILYASAEKFLNECISGIRRNTMDKFRLRYRERCDVLLIDDIQTLARGEAVQDEFFHTLNDFFESKRQVVVASDRMPNDIQGLEDRIRSRLQWGLIADIQVSDMETRLAILRYKAERQGIRLPDEVAHFIAGISKKSIRELEGNLNRMIIFTELRGVAISLDVAKNVFSSYSLDQETITSSEIQKMVAEAFNVKVPDLKSKNRSEPLVTARQIAMYLIKKYLDQPVTEIGRSFNKDHSTVINALRRIESQRVEKKELDTVINNLETRINNILGL